MTMKKVNKSHTYSLNQSHTYSHTHKHTNIFVVYIVPSVSSRTIRRLLNNNKLYGRISHHGHPFTEDNKKKRLSFANGYKNWTKQDWEKVHIHIHTLIHTHIYKFTYTYIYTYYIYTQQFSFFFFLFLSSKKRIYQKNRGNICAFFLTGYSYV